MTRWTTSVSAVGLLGLLMAAHGCDCGGEGLSRLRPEIEVSPTELLFDEVPLGASRSLSVAVTNEGTDALVVCLSAASQDGCVGPSGIVPEAAPFAARFEGEGEAGWTVERGESRSFEVAFAPLEAGAASAVLRLEHNAKKSPTEIPLSGTGVPPSIDFDRDAIDFGETTVGTRKVRELVLTNRTQFPQPLSIEPLVQSAVIFGTVAADGQDTPIGAPFLGEVPGGGTLTVRVFYQPPEEGPHQNTLRVSFCPACTKDIPLSGIGTKPVFLIEPPRLDFGTLPEGQTSTRTFVITNIGNVGLEVSSFDRTPGTSSEFTIVPRTPLPTMLGPTETMEVDVHYVGVTPGHDQGLIQVGTNAWNDPGTPSDEAIGFVVVDASSTGPDIDVLPAALNFGTVSIMGAPLSRNVLIQNVGTSPLELSNVQLNAPGSEVRIEPVLLPATIAPGDVIVVAVSYAPQDAGMDRAELVVVSNDRDEGTLIIPVEGMGGVPTTCQISIEPSQLGFGIVERGALASRSIEIRNTGAQPCTVSTLMVEGGPEFALAVGTPPTATIPPGFSQRIAVEYSPATYGTHRALLMFSSDDPAQPMTWIPLSGASSENGLVVVPSPLDFHATPVGCRSAERDVTLYNTGSSAITVSNVSLEQSTSPEFELLPYVVPATLPAGTPSVINLRYHPAGVGTDMGLLVIEHSASSIPALIPLVGEGQTNPTVTESFVQFVTPKVDVLFIIDNSRSMAEEQAFLADNLASFVLFAQQQGIDYHLAATTTDVCWRVDFTHNCPNVGESGRFVPINGAPRIITQNTPDGITEFSNIIAGIGIMGSGTEEGLTAANLALAPPVVDNENAGFLRADAALAIIVVSDEDDFSPRELSYYETFFRGLKGFQNLFSFSAVVGTEAPHCTSATGDAAYASRYLELAQATGGAVESICDSDWGQALANVGQHSFGLKTIFPLGSAPDPSTIAVSVNGVATSSVSGMQPIWSYDQPTNSVVFSLDATPSANSTITVTYSVACL